MTTHTPAIEARDLVIGYDGQVVVHGLDLALPRGSFTVILGPNASGKSTVLRALARVLRPKTGQVLLDGRALAQIGMADDPRAVTNLITASAARAERTQAP